MPCNFPLVQTKFKLPGTLIKKYKIQGIAENEEISEIIISENRRRFIIHEINWSVKTLRFIPISTHGDEYFRLFSFEIE